MRLGSTRRIGLTQRQLLMQRRGKKKNSSCGWLGRKLKKKKSSCGYLGRRLKKNQHGYPFENSSCSWLGRRLNKK